MSELTLLFVYADSAGLPNQKLPLDDHYAKEHTNKGESQREHNYVHD